MFGTPAATPAFGATPSTPAFGAAGFGASSSTPAFGTPSTPSFATSGAAFGSSLFPSPSPFSQTPQPSPFTPLQQQQPQQPGFGFQQPSSAPFGSQLTTQMAPVAPLPLPLADRDVQAIVDAYRDDPSNPKYSFRHLLFSVTDPSARVKPLATSDIMWAEAMGKLEGMESADRERLWPQLVQGFKDLSDRIKLQDEVMVSDSERLQMTQANVKMLQRHFQADTLPWIQRMKLKEQELRRRLLRVMRIVEALEGKGFRMPLMKDEADLAEKLSNISRQLKKPGAEIPRKIQGLLSVSRTHANAGIVGGSISLPNSMKIEEQSLADLQEVLQRQTEAISRLVNVLKRDTRDMDIILSRDTDMVEDGTNGRA
ncbi:nuclear pore complex protein [Wolffia australiana]